jgi:type IV pilus assembly protein PilC
MMPAYQYTARDATGQEIRSVYTDVESVGVLRRDLAKLGYRLVRARRQRAAAQAGRRVRQRDIASFAYKFAGMYSAGLPIATCLETLEQQTRQRALREVIGDIRRRVQAGASLKSAFEVHRSVFSDFFLGMINAGESAGKLGQSLELSAQHLEKRLDLRQKTRAAFVYPVVVGTVCTIVVTCLLIFVVPTFSTLYDRLHVGLPYSTRVLVEVSILLRREGWFLLALAGVLALLAWRLLARPRVRIHWDRLKVRLPVLGPLNRLVLVSQFIRTFGMMLAVGVPIMEALDAAGKVAHNGEIMLITADLQQSIRAGRPIARSLAAYHLFPPMVVQFVAAGEEAGILPDMLRKGADLLEKEADRLTASLLVRLEPALTIMMGIVIGLILLGVYLPMFDYMASLR